ncbi:MAG: glucose PTS transporter subunit IIA [Acetatifactor sp.]|nr:glucose PTS transporter subunit IIA [Acetatifactor sp.]
MDEMQKKQNLPKLDVTDTDIVALADGELIDVATVSDDVFAQKMMGESIAFRYTGNRVVLCAPANGTLSAVFPTGHAYGITTKEGVEILVHCGVNTVEANGDGFRMLGKEQGEEVRAGDPIVEVDFDRLSATYDMSTMLIITEANNKQIIFKDPCRVKRGESVLKAGTLESTTSTASTAKKGTQQANASKYTELCNRILEKVGGKNNITGALHCMTRLRLTLKDESKVEIDAVKKIKGVLGAQFSGGQFQIIIGPTVGEVYKEFCDITGLNAAAAVEENLDDSNGNQTKEKFDIKKLPAAILSYISGSVAPVLPIMLGAGFFKMFYSMLGPDLLKLLSPDSAFMTTLNIIGNAGFYFLPIFVAWSAAKRRNTSIQMALVLSVLLIDPNIVQIVAAGEPFRIYGLFPMSLNNYSQAVLPPLLMVWVLEYVYAFIEKHMPNSLKVIGVPFVTLIVMTPLELCVLAPVANWIGKLVTMFISAIYQYAGPVAVALIGALWMFMIATGMHIAVIQMALINLTTMGYDPVVLSGSTVAQYTLMGIALAYFIRSKGEEKQIAGANAVTLIAGGLSEPTLFGLLLQNKRAMLYQIIAGGIGGLLCGLLKAAFYTMAAANFLNALGFAGSTGENFVKGVISCAVGFGIALLLGLILGFDDSKKQPITETGK